MVDGWILPPVTLVRVLGPSLASLWSQIAAEPLTKEFRRRDSSIGRRLGLRSGDPGSNPPTVKELIGDPGGGLWLNHACDSKF